MYSKKEDCIRLRLVSKRDVCVTKKRCCVVSWEIMVVQCAPRIIIPGSEHQEVCVLLDATTGACMVNWKSKIRIKKNPLFPAHDYITFSSYEVFVRRESKKSCKREIHSAIREIFSFPQRSPNNTNCINV